MKEQDEHVTRTDALAALRAALRAREDAPRDAPVRVHNRLMTAVHKQCDLLAQTPEGRSALAAATEADENPQLRLVAATTVQRWDVDRARATLEDLVKLSDGTVVRPMTMTAACAVRGEPGWSAALCLLNLDDPRPTTQVTPPTVGKVPVASGLLDAAERVYSLTMNGGIDHAYEQVGELFPAAAEACDAVGAEAEADMLRGVLALLGTGHDGTRTARAAALAALTSEQDKALQALNERFCAVDDLMARLEAAAEV